MKQATKTVSNLKCFSTNFGQDQEGNASEILEVVDVGELQKNAVTTEDLLVA